jgi:type I restriction enzyme S subunit
VSDLPKGWTVAAVPEIAEVLDSRRIPLNASERATRKGPFAYYGANGQVDSIDAYLFDGPHVLVAEDGGYFDQPERGVAYLVDGKFWVNNHAHILRPRDGIDPRYLLNVINSTNWMPHVGGTTRLKLTQAALGEPALPVAPAAEQSRIVAKLDALSARSKRARAELERVEALAERASRALAETLFSGEPRAGYSVCPLAELINEGPSNGWSPRSGDDATGALTLKLSATTTGRMVLSPKTTKRIYDELERDSPFWLRPGDLLVQRANSLEYVGSSAVYDGPEMTYIYPDLMMRLRITDPTLRTYVWLYLNSPPARRYLQARATGTAGNMPKISGATLRSLPVPIPTTHGGIKEAVHQMQALSSSTDRTMAECSGAMRLLSRLDQSILSRAFRGELVPQDPSDEPASVLLDRIRAERQAGGAAPKRRRRAG